MLTSSFRDACLLQAASCRDLGSPFTGQVMEVLAAGWPEDTRLAGRVAAFEGDVTANGLALPLRVAAGLHALVLIKRDAGLASCYPPHLVDRAQLRTGVIAALHQHDEFLCDWTTSPPQTNEVRRSAVLIAAGHVVSKRYGLPLRLSELGASAGLHLMFDKYELKVGDTTWGPADATVALSPDWRGAIPPHGDLEVVERCGVDLNPLRVGNAADELRLMSYIWPDQYDRFLRTRAAIEIFDAEVDKGDAIDWLQQRLVSPTIGAVHFVYHTVAWQYFPADLQERGRGLMETAGAAATDDTPLAWFSMEGHPDHEGAVLTLRLWPGDERISLGFAGFHGQWVEWRN